jgi:hypothetical protein
MVKLATERVLSDDERALLGCFRLAYRTLARSLQANRRLGVGIRDSDERIVAYDDWNSSDAPSYQAFKVLVAAVGQAGRTPDASTPSSRYGSLPTTSSSARSESAGHGIGSAYRRPRIRG